MKSILTILCTAFVALACTRTEKWSVELHKIVANATGKDLYYEVKTDEGSGGAFVKAYDSVDIRFYREHDVEMWLLEAALTSTVRQNDIKVEQEDIFNIADTSKYKYTLEYEIIPQQGSTEDEKIFARHLTREFGEQSTDRNVNIIVRLSVTDSILNIMQKDYAMLDKFKAYYEQK
jgi:hypothetical protein